LGSMGRPRRVGLMGRQTVMAGPTVMLPGYMA